MKMRGGIRLMCLAGALALVGALPGSAAAEPVTEFKLGVNWISDLAQGPDGVLWYSGWIGNFDNWEARIGRVGSNGLIGETRIANGPPQKIARGSAGIAVGPEGDAWFFVADEKVKDNVEENVWPFVDDGSLNRMTSSGARSEVAIAPGGARGGRTAAARSGGIWFTQGAGSKKPELIGRVGPSGAVTELPLLQTLRQPGAIVEGSDGNAWFVERFTNAIGRMTPSGGLTEFPLPPGSEPSGITADPSGNIWFIEQLVGKIGRLDPAGELTELDLPNGIVYPGEIAYGGDGRLWFTINDLGKIGRITPAGQYSEVRLPNRRSNPRDVIAGAEGNVWYAAIGEGPCRGGGGACSKWEPRNPAVVGRIEPTPLRTAIATHRIALRRHGLRLRLTCEGGRAWDRCHGRLKLKRRGRVLAATGYSLAADESRLVRMRRKPGFRALLRGRRAARVTAVAAPRGGGGSRRAIGIVRGHREGAATEEREATAASRAD